MLIIPETALSTAMQGLVGATHQAMTIEGRHFTVGTINPQTLRLATLAALAVIVGTPVDSQPPGALPPQGS